MTDADHAGLKRSDKMVETEKNNVESLPDWQRRPGHKSI